MRLCRRRLHEIPAGKEECPVCRKARDDVYRLNARLAGKDASRQREWFAARYTDPVFREKERERNRERERRPEYRLAKRWGIGPQAARSILEGNK